MNLEQIFEDASVLAQGHLKKQLSYKQMLVMVDSFLQWAMLPEVTPEVAVKLVGQAKALRQLADTVGEAWAPPEPERLSLVGFIARECEKTDK